MFFGPRHSVLRELRVRKRRPARLAISRQIESLEVRTLLNATLVDDIHAGPLTPSEIVSVGSTVYYTVQNRLGGTDLYRTNGSVGGSTLVRSFPKVRDSFFGAEPTVSNLTAVGTSLFFAGEDTAIGRELWRYDGVNPPVAIDVYPGSTNGVPNSSSPSQLVVAGTSLFFLGSGLANNVATGQEVWRYTPGSATAQLVADAQPGPVSSRPTNLTAVGNNVVFVAFSSLFVSNGTVTQRLNELFVDPVRFQPIDPASSFSVRDGKAYFTAFYGPEQALGFQPWVSDGTFTGTIRLTTISPINLVGRSPHDYTSNALGMFYFIDQATVSELWRTGGTPATTVKIADVPLLTSGEDTPVPESMIAAGNRLFFSLRNPVTSELTLWTSDGQPGGSTIPLKTITPGSQSYFDVSTVLRDQVAINDNLFFPAFDTTNGLELWRSDGTFAGTVPVTNIAPGAASSMPRNLGIAAGQVYFAAHDTEGSSQLWKFNPANNQSLKIETFDPSFSSVDFPASRYPTYVTDSSFPTQAFTLGSITLFVADDGVHGFELWKTNGTTGGTSLVRDFRPAGDGNPSAFTLFEGQAHFLIEGNDSAAGLWRTNGSTLTQLAAIPGINSDFVLDGMPVLTGANAGLYFTSFDTLTSQAVLWRYNGSGGATQVRTFSGGELRFISELTQVGNQLFFSVDDGVNGNELWKSDGSNGGTQLVENIFPGSTNGTPNSSSPSELTAVGGTLFFRATDASGSELWKSDGTVDGTSIVQDLAAGPTGSSPRFLTAVGGTLFFAANRSDVGEELWKSTGTSIELVANIYPGNASSQPFDFFSLNGQLIFFANDGTHGFEGWRSDGTQAGTSLIRDLNPRTTGTLEEISSASRSSFRGRGRVIGDQLYYPAFTPNRGRELWSTTGFASETFLVADVYAGPGSSSPFVLEGLNGQVLFSANDGSLGFELYTAQVRANRINTTPSDFNGDGKTDYSVFRPEDWSQYDPALPQTFGAPRWYTILNLGDNDGDGKAEVGFWDWARQWGLAGDVPVPGDYDGDAWTDYTVFRPNDNGRATWYVALNQGLGQQIGLDLRAWGFPAYFSQPGNENYYQATDIPVAGDYDGDGISDLAVFRPSTRTFHVLANPIFSNGVAVDLDNGNLGTGLEVWPGLSGDVTPIPGDFNGDGRSDFAVYQPSTGRWLIRLNLPNGTRPYAYQPQPDTQTQDIAVRGDFNADGRSDFAVFRPMVPQFNNTSAWYIYLNQDLVEFAAPPAFQPGGPGNLVLPYIIAQPLGIPGDFPLTGDFDGNGRADISVFRPDAGYPKDANGNDITAFGRLSAWFTITNSLNPNGSVRLDVFDWNRWHGSAPGTVTDVFGNPRTVIADIALPRNPVVRPGYLTAPGNLMAPTINPPATTNPGLPIVVVPMPSNPQDGFLPAVQSTTSVTSPFSILRRRKARLT